MIKESMRVSGLKLDFLACGMLVLAFSLFFLPSRVNAQEVVDKTVATVSDRVRTELITYSDLLWQLALQPRTPLDSPSKDDLDQALRLVIDQRLITLETRRLPSISVTEAETQAEIKQVLDQFSSTAEFVDRLRAVGFESTTDYNFQKLMEQRVAIEKYLDFRFRSFVVITAEQEESYYKDVFVPSFRTRNPGVVPPPIGDVRPRINQDLTTSRISSDLDRFLDNARERAEIVILSEP
jgi:hypothetical protein